jgi:hypothetical protein
VRFCAASRRHDPMPEPTTAAEVARMIADAQRDVDAS